MINVAKTAGFCYGVKRAVDDVYKEPKGGRKVHFLAQRRMQSEHLIEKVGKELRGMMSWMKK